MIVKDPRSTVYKFKVNRWFAKTEDDGQIERQISASMFNQEVLNYFEYRRTIKSLFMLT